MHPFIQNHPGQQDTRPRPVGSTNSQGVIFAVVVLTAIPVAISIAVLRRLTAIGRIDSWVMYAIVTTLSILCVIALVLITKKVLYKNVAEQRKYYRLAGGLSWLPQEKREALQLEAPFCYQAGQWIETLEYWPAAVRLAGHVRFTTFQLTSVEERLAANDVAWQVLSEKSYTERVEALFGGMHSRLFAADQHLQEAANRKAMLTRLGELTQLSDIYISSCWASREGRPALLVWAFDLQRVVELSRTSFMAGLISEQQAWENILQASRYSHALFSDLDDFLDNYRLGHAYWSNDFNRTNETAQMQKGYHNNCNWPIKTVSWTKGDTSFLPPAMQNSCRDYVQEQVSKTGRPPIGFQGGNSGLS